MKIKKKCEKKFLKTSCFLTKFLYTNEINKIGIKNKFLKNFFLGAYPAVVPEKIKPPCCWIWNTDTQNESGKHWVAVWLTKKNMFFPDSFAKSISFYSREYWGVLAKKLNAKFTYVQQQGLQSKITYTCGNWCLLYKFQKNVFLKMFYYYISYITVFSFGNTFVLTRAFS